MEKKVLFLHIYPYECWTLQSNHKDYFVVSTIQLIIADFLVPDKTQQTLIVIML